MRMVVGLTLSALLTLFVGQEPTLSELAQQQRTPLLKAIGSEESVRSFASLANDANLVVQGAVRPVRTYLSEDGTLIYTDFELTPTNFIAGSQAPQRIPGPEPRIVIRQLGGKLQLAGTDVTVVDERLGLLPADEPLILFLEEIENGIKYQLVGRHWGAFEVKAGKIVPLVKPQELQADLSGMLLADFVRDINKLRALRP